MPLSPYLLERLQELKLWQESHDELLKKTQTLINTSANITTASDYHTIEGLSAFDSSSETSVKNLENHVISPTKSFNELLEEKLAQDPGPQDAPPKPKKPFLRKGTGLERFRMKPQIVPPIKKKPVKSPRNVTPLRAPDVSVQPKASWCKIGDSDDHIRKINEIANAGQELGEQTLYEKALEKELRIFEALEERAENSSFCSTNSSVLRILSSTPSKIRTGNDEKKVHWEPQSEEEDVIETNLEKRDIAEILLRLKNLAENRIKPPIPSIIEVSDEEKWSSTEPSSDTTSISSEDLEETLCDKRDIGVGTGSSENCAICGDKYQKKIHEYEEKIRDVIEDKNRIIDLRKQLEQKERDFVRKKCEFENDKENFLFELESERKRLNKERQAFQTFMKDSQNRPNKKERQEISNLKQEVADLTETLKLKESKNGMTQARLRNQIKQLEKENSNLKTEIEKLTKENAKLSATQKLARKSSDSKILHEINKNVAKLTQIDKNSNIGMLDKEDSLLELARSPLEEKYENTFKNQSLDKDLSDKIEPTNHNRRNSSDKFESTNSNRRDSSVTLDDGTKQIRYPNGNIKTISPDGNFVTVKYFNGDTQETNLRDGTVKYFFASRNICQTTYNDGLEVVEFPEGLVERRFPDGRSEITLPDGAVQTTFPDGSLETKYKDGSIVKIQKNGDKILFLPNGQKEIETQEFKSREYPDGTVKTLYPDGTQETKYSNGRVRIKNAEGKLVLDTHL